MSLKRDKNRKTAQKKPKNREKVLEICGLMCYTVSMTAKVYFQMRFLEDTNQRLNGTNQGGK